ncbi:hypothetical protein MGG_11149 [Pyricularia oryzae 70-15]|uniref:SUN domain-containing protein n=5 Tax=Pyricularia TaxID=48558 RepID=G4MVC2_PYRO7|nr:uncharacterized protein MGG_11149 [Pyricularia oryzae 70-15]EHA54944.1 hypothetical protein MGG_11149 [Pyricularia oryzae 70-15]
MRPRKTLVVTYSRFNPISLAQSDITMKTATLGAALLLLGVQQCAATSGHRSLHRQFEKRHGHNHLPTRSFEADLRSPESEESGNISEVRKRGSSCSLPDDDDSLVRITDTRNDNQGFAMSPDQTCEDGMYCPFACKPGMLMNQWKEGTSFKPVESMQGGLYCDNGKPKKPFPSKPYCVQGTGTVKAVNKCGKVVSFCQTVLPGNEAMLIPTEVSGSTTLAVPGPDYWAGTAAHFYINPPGVSADQGCRWGSDANDVGNWSPYVAGANTVSDGRTFVQLSWNPIYEDSKWSSKKPSFGVKIECDGDCNGLPCEINPAKTGLKNVNSKTAASGAGGASFCVVTVSKGSSANIVLFNTDGSTGDSSSSEEPKKTTTSSSSSTPSSTSTTAPPSSYAKASYTTSSISLTIPTVRPGIFQENSTSSTDSSSWSGSASTTKFDSTQGSSSTSSAASPSSTNDGAQRDKGGAAMAGLVIAIVAAAWMY